MKLLAQCRSCGTLYAPAEGRKCECPEDANVHDITQAKKKPKDKGDSHRRKGRGGYLRMKR